MWAWPVNGRVAQQVLVVKSHLSRRYASVHFCSAGLECLLSNISRSVCLPWKHISISDYLLAGLCKYSEKNINKWSHLSSIKCYRRSSRAQFPNGTEITSQILTKRQYSKGGYDAMAAGSYITPRRPRDMRWKSSHSGWIKSLMTGKIVAFLQGDPCREMIMPKLDEKWR